jgi:hypothetical protein
VCVSHNRDYTERIIVKNESSALISTFAIQKAKSIKSGSLVQLLGFRGDTNLGKTGKRYSNLVAEGITVETIPSDSNLLCQLSKYMDITQRPVYPPPQDTTNYQKKTFMLSFSDFERTPEETKEERGPVSMSILVNSDNPDDWKKPPIAKDGVATLKGTWRMTVEQDIIGVPAENRNTFPVGQFQVVAKVIEGDWTDHTAKTALREGFGINDTNIFSDTLAQNPVPGLLACSDDLGTTASQNVGEVDFEREPGKLYYWCNSAIFYLRSYLLTECGQISLDSVRYQLQLSMTDPLESLFLQTDNSQRPNLLNRKNTRQGYGDEPALVLINDKVVCLTGGYSGKIIDLVKQGVEFRVMHNVPLKPEERVALAKMPIEEAEKCFNRDRTAKLRLSKAPNMVVYAVVPYSNDELKHMMETDATWKLRREQRAKIQAEIDKRDAPIKQAQDDADAAAVAAIEAEMAARAAGKSQAATTTTPAMPPSQTPKRDLEAEDEEDNGDAKAMDQGPDDDGEDDDDVDRNPSPAKKSAPPAVAKRPIPVKKAIPGVAAAKK